MPYPSHILHYQNHLYHSVGLNMVYLKLSSVILQSKSLHHSVGLNMIYFGRPHTLFYNTLHNIFCL